MFMITIFEQGKPIRDREFNTFLECLRYFNDLNNPNYGYKIRNPYDTIISSYIGVQ